MLCVSFQLQPKVKGCCFQGQQHGVIWEFQIFGLLLMNLFSGQEVTSLKNKQPVFTTLVLTGVHNIGTQSRDEKDRTINLLNQEVDQNDGLVVYVSGTSAHAHTRVCVKRF